MTLYLVEGEWHDERLDQVKAALDRIAARAADQQGDLIEAKLAKETHRLIVILEAPSEAAALSAFAAGNWSADLVKAVRLVGQDFSALQARKGKANYLVEWDLPRDLTMDHYLQRKAEKSPLYAQVPEVQFERTYVCEDLSKCLCFYDSPDAATVEQARAVVGAPIDRLSEIEHLG